MEAQSDTFMATLSQISATVLILLVGGVVAYLSFVHQRRTSYEDELTRERLAIREILVQIRVQWKLGVHMLMPVGFKARYKELSPHIGGMALWVKAFSSLVFEQAGMETDVRRAIAQVKPTLLKSRYWISTARVWIIEQMVAVLTQMDFSSAAHTHDGLFPCSPVELGFTEWREDYSSLSLYLQFLKPLRSELVKGIAAYEKEEIGTTGQLSHIVTDALDQLLEGMAAIDQKLQHIDRLQITRDRLPSFSRATKMWISFFALLAFIVGLLVPMICMAWSAKVSPIVSLGLALITFVAFGVSIFLFSKQLVREVHPLSGKYLHTRWMEPMRQALQQHSESVRNGDIVDYTVFQDAQVLGKRDGLSQAMLEEIQHYIQAASHYNESLKELSELVAEQILNNFDEAIKPPMRVGGSALRAVDWLDTAQREQLLKSASANESAIILQLEAGLWRRDLVALPLKAWKGATAELLERASAVADTVQGSKSAAKLRCATDSLGDCMNSLRSYFPEQRVQSSPGKAK